MQRPRCLQRLAFMNAISTAWLRGSSLLLWFLSGWLCAQETAHPPCATTEVDSLLRAQYPALGDQGTFESWLSRAMARRPATGQRSIYTIPVIVHVVHDGEATGSGNNIDSSQVLSQIAVLNEDFRRRLGTPGFNQDPVGADVEIEFCLATIDPYGQALPEPGIHRIDRNAQGFFEPPYSTSYIRSDILPATYWDPDRYMNIWVVPIQNEVIGFAQMPSQSTLPDLPSNQGPATTDGVVINVETFGRSAHLATPYNQGRTATHEVGHWLGLWHIWGDGNCNADDFCEDTPQAEREHYGCPAAATSCGSADMVSNYMDYLDDACMNTFTRCQKQRMRTVLENAPRRASLLSSNVCAGQLPPVAEFRVNQAQTCAGKTVQFFDESLYVPNAWSWSFPGGSPSSSTDPNPTVTYTQPGLYDVALTVSNDLGTQTQTRTAYIEVSETGSSSEVYAEDFEAGFNGWVIENPDNATTWQLVETEGNSGKLAPGIELYAYTDEGARDALVSPPLDLRGFTNLKLQFAYAYRPFSSAATDSLRVEASTDGGLSYPYPLYADGQGGSEATFATGPTAGSSFTPTTTSDWCGTSNGAPCVSVKLEAIEGASRVRLRFTAVNGYGNNLYVDDIRIIGICTQATASQTPANPRAQGWRVYPNPSQGRFTLETPKTAWPVDVHVYDWLGRRHWQDTTIPTGGKVELDLSQLPPGTYLLRGQGPSGIPFVQQLQIAPH